MQEGKDHIAEGFTLDEIQTARKIARILVPVEFNATHGTLSAHVLVLALRECGYAVAIAYPSSQMETLHEAMEQMTQDKYKGYLPHNLYDVTCHKDNRLPQDEIRFLDEKYRVLGRVFNLTVPVSPREAQRYTRRFPTRKFLVRISDWRK